MFLALRLLDFSIILSHKSIAAPEHKLSYTEEWQYIFRQVNIM